MDLLCWTTLMAALCPQVDADTCYRCLPAEQRGQAVCTHPSVLRGAVMSPATPAPPEAGGEGDPHLCPPGAPPDKSQLGGKGQPCSNPLRALGAQPGVREAGLPSTQATWVTSEGDPAPRLTDFGSGGQLLHRITLNYRKLCSCFTASIFFFFLEPHRTHAMLKWQVPRPAANNRRRGTHAHVALTSRVGELGSQETVGEGRRHCAESNRCGAARRSGRA